MRSNKRYNFFDEICTSFGFGKALVEKEDNFLDKVADTLPILPSN